MIGPAVTDDALPMAFHQANELLKRLEPAPAQLGLPVLEELPGPGGMVVVPQLPERLFEEIRFMEPLVGLEQQLQRAPAFQIQVGRLGEERIPLPLDEAPVLMSHPPVLQTADLVQRIRQVPKDVELVVDNLHLRGMAQQRVPERLPHVHDRQAQAAVPPGSHLLEESVHVLFGAPQFFAHPDRPPLVQVGHHDGIALPPADRDFINSDGPQTFLRQVFRPKLPHVADVHPPNLIPTKPMELRHLLDRHAPALPPHDLLEALREAAGVRQPCQGFLLHRAAPAAVHPAILEFQVNPCATRVHIPYLMALAVVEAARSLAA